ncbi:hypothetical protein [Cucumibacter marinus]|uniref:hypothetical protein n=1 Tax=Cucumibacter marinus TaxID=1121252 RepID=UPI0004266399|nr:hypothetical protein [Cucumibacter marinus]
MLTTTHMLVAGATLSRPSQRWYHIAAAWFGGFFPDMSVFVMVGYGRAMMDNANLWRKPEGLYWQEPWQTFSAISNSMPLYASLIALGYWISRASERLRGWGVGLMLFAGAAMTHVVLDFPVHTDDAHIHFWPLTDWRFHSPVSYYQRDHYGGLVGTVEIVVGVILAALVIWRFRRWPLTVLAVLLALPYFLSIGLIFFWDPF